MALTSPEQFPIFNILCPVCGVGGNGLSWLCRGSSNFLPHTPGKGVVLTSPRAIPELQHFAQCPRNGGNGLSGSRWRVLQVPVCSPPPKCGGNSPRANFSIVPHVPGDGGNGLSGSCRSDLQVGAWKLESSSITRVPIKVELKHHESSN